MPADHEARERLAGAIEDYLEERIDNFALDDHLTRVQTEDTACKEIAGELWFFYDDCSRHFNSGKWRIDENDEQSIRRWIQLLRSPTDWIWEEWHTETPPSGSACRSIVPKRMNWKASARERNRFWPWSDESDWRSWSHTR